MTTATLEITTMLGCPLKCTFCPQDQLKAAYGKLSDKYMSLETFSTVLNKLPLHVRVDFAGMAEPWVNPHATEMLRAALERGHRVAIYTTLYNMSVDDSIYITTDLLPKYESQIEVVCLHLPDENMNMRGYKGSDQYRHVLMNFLSIASSFPRLTAMTMDKSGRIHPDLRDMIPNLNAWKGHSRAGSLGEEQTKKLDAMVPPQKDFPLVCAKTPFYDQNVLLPNGDVALCCMDYGLTTILGNLLTHDYWDLFSSHELLKLRMENQKPGFSKCSICKSCERAIPAKEQFAPI